MATPCTMSYGAVNGKGKSNHKGHKNAHFVLISNYQLAIALQYIIVIYLLLLTICYILAVVCITYLIFGLFI